jgi:DNA repair photolyase
VIIREIRCRSVLTKTGIPTIDYAINPYIGCAHGCVYCYARFMKRYTGHTEEWGAFVDVKAHAAEVLARQMKRAKYGRITLSSVTDPYQPAESTYEVTRHCLEVLTSYDFPVSILTKSPLVLRDIDILATMKDVSVGFSLSTLSQEVAVLFEPRLPSIEERLSALERLGRDGITTWAFCGPLLPYLSDHEREIDVLFGALASVGASSIIVDSMNLRGATLQQVLSVLKKHHPDLVERYRRLAANRGPYHRALMRRAQRQAQKHGLTIVN